MKILTYIIIAVSVCGLISLGGYYFGLTKYKEGYNKAKLECAITYTTAIVKEKVIIEKVHANVKKLKPSDIDNQLSALGIMRDDKDK